MMRLVAAGLVGALLAIGIVTAVFGRPDWSGSAKADSTWRLAEFPGIEMNPDSSNPDPNKYLLDWLSTISASCKVNPVYLTWPNDALRQDVVKEIDVYYACP